MKKSLSRYPLMTEKDAAKLIYQNVFGCAHIIESENAREYIEKELEGVPADENAACEHIGNSRARLPLSYAKALGLRGDIIYSLCRYSAERAGEKEEYIRKIEEAAQAAEKEILPLDKDTLLSFAGVDAPISHSEIYRENYKPHYRVIDSRCETILPLLSLTEKKLCEKERMIMALDGDAASGKSTAAEILKYVYGAAVIHMDDFFLPPEMRSEERLGAPGGNVHYERFSDEVLPNIGNDFCYRIFDCATGEYGGVREIQKSRVTVIEGSYSLHPVFGRYADIEVFMKAGKEEQIRRIKERSGDKMLEKFEKIWIPMEKKYHAAFGIEERCDIMLENN